MKTDLYQAPTLILLAVVVAIFAGLWLRGTSLAAHEEPLDGRPTTRRRQMFWLAGWVLAVVHLSLQMADWHLPGWHLALSLCALVLAPLMFLASLAPQYAMRKPPVPFIAAFGLPVIVYCVTVGLNPVTGPMLHTLLLICAAAGIALTVWWSLDEQLLPAWASLSIVVLVGAAAGWLTLRQQYGEVILLTQAGVLIMTALLFVSAFRRVSAGLVFTVGGLVLWALPALLKPLLHVYVFPAGLERAGNLVMVIAAMGMILLVLEEEIAANVTARQRDHRTRLEMEKYTAVYVADLAFEDESSAYDKVCRTIAEVSRFSQAAIFVQSPEGRFMLAGRAGIARALEVALDAMARRTSASLAQQIASGKGITPVAGNLMLLDLNPLMEPGDDLEQMNFRRAWVMGIRTREGRLQGALMLSGLRNQSMPLNIEDVLPLELLVARIGAARDHAVLTRRLVQSERLAGLGQLAGGVAHELNNPLQAVTGFAELLADGNDESTTTRHATVILSEARRMKQIIDSLLRFRKASLMERMPVSLADLLADVQADLQAELGRSQFELHIHIPEDLPRVRADAEQIRQVFIQLVKNAMDAFGEETAQDERVIRIEAAQQARNVHLVISHKGRAFAEPARAFDPFFKAPLLRDGGSGARPPDEVPQGSGQGLGLSICYAIVREHGGTISAVNLHPVGAAVVIDLPTAGETSNEARGSDGKEAQPRSIFADKDHAPAR